MSRIPRIGGNRPLTKTSNTVSSKTPSGGQRTVTTTKIRELRPAESSELSQTGGAPCGTCPTNQTGGQSMVSGLTSFSGRPTSASTGIRPPSGGSGMNRPGGMGPPSGGSGMNRPGAAGVMRPPSAGGSGIRPPSASGGMRPPSAGSGINRPCAAGGRGPPSAGSGMNRPSRRAAEPAPAPQLRAPMPGQYNVPAAYGPMSRQGKGMVYSSPEALRGQMEARVPKELKYEAIKMGREGGVLDRTALQGTTMVDTFSGNYNVYGGTMPPPEMGDTSDLDERINP